MCIIGIVEVMVVSKNLALTVRGAGFSGVLNVEKFLSW